MEVTGHADTARPSDFSLLPLPWDLTAPSLARQLVRSTLWAWGLTELTEDAVLAVSELTTNAVLHGAAPMSVTLHRDPDQLRIVVHDSGHGVVLRVPQTAPETAERGRGLAIVRDVSSSSGIGPEAGDGTRAYATFACRPA